MTVPKELHGFETYIVSYSGGKDSTAMALWALEHLPRRKLRFVFSDTGAEWPETYAYLDYIEGKLNIKVERVKAGDRERLDTRDHSVFMDKTNLFDMIRARGRWPRAKYRYCTTYLKRWPIQLYGKECPAPVVNLFGQRREESQARSKLSVYDPGGNKTGVPIYRPVLGWSEVDVWQHLSDHEVLPNLVYNHATRANCWCCPMARPQELFNFCRQYPHEAQRWADLEVEIGHTWQKRLSISNILSRALAQMPLFKPQPRFPKDNLGWPETRREWPR